MLLRNEGSHGRENRQATRDESEQTSLRLCFRAAGGRTHRDVLRAPGTLLHVTAVAVALVAGLPTIVGDMIITDRDGKRVAAVGKVYEFGPNLVIGWSGNFLVAREALGRLRSLEGQIVSLSQMAAALDGLQNLRG